MKQTEKVAVTEANLDDVRSLMSALDQRREIRVGMTISHYPILYEGGQRGDVTVYHDTARAAICLGGDSEWGDWSERDGRLTLDATDADGEAIVYDSTGARVEAR